MKHLLHLLSSHKFFRAVRIKFLLRFSGKRPDRDFLEKLYKISFRKKPNIDNPKTFNEHILWMKLYYRNDIMHICSDKARLHEFVDSRGLSSYLPKNYGVFDEWKQIDFSNLPNEFVIKTNHDSGGVAIVRSKSDEAQIRETKRIIDTHKKLDFGHRFREWSYYGIKPKIIIEELIKSEDACPKDYKFFCFDGEPKFLFVAANRDVSVTFDFFDMEWRHLAVTNSHPNSKKPLSKPENFDEMVSIARTLSKGFPHVRIDLYSEFGKIYIGEMTFYHFGGNERFIPDSYDDLFGSYFSIPKVEAKKIR
jgi:hypothetical protein